MDGDSKKYLRDHCKACRSKHWLLPRQLPLPGQEKVNHAWWFCMAHLQIKISGHPTFNTQRFPHTCHAHVHVWCLLASLWRMAFALEEEVSSHFHTVHNAYVSNTYCEITFFRKKTFTVFKVRRWLNRSTSLRWTQDSHLILPSTAQTLGSENGRENWIIGQKKCRLNSLKYFRLKEVKGYSWARCEAGAQVHSGTGI